MDSTLQKYPRIPDYNTKHNPEFNPRTYISIQERVNNDPDFENFYLNKLIKEGWYKLANVEHLLSEEMKGRHFKYRLNGKSMSGEEKGTFRSGGIIIGRDKNNNGYILYKAYNGCLFPLQLKDINDIYIKDPNSKLEGNKKEKNIKGTVSFKYPVEVTAFPVHLNEKIIHYAKDNYKRDRFMLSKKFEYAYKTGDWKFV